MSITKITINHLVQLKELAENLTDDQLSKKLKVLNDASIGSHIRHILEFYMCLFEFDDLKHLNYDNRKRDRTIEVSSEKCVLIVEGLLIELQKYKKDFEITLSADYGGSHSDEKVFVQTTFFRELLYNVEHSVHHLAIIKIGIQSLETKVAISDDLGVAASTIRNRELCAQ